MLKKPFSLHKTPHDTYAFSALIILLSLLIAWTNLYNRPQGDLFVSVYIESSLVEQYSLYEEQQITYLPEDYASLQGPLTLEIADEGMRIIEETSPLNICSNQGWIRDPGLPLICAPNQFMAVIEVIQ
jgi:hypothetical protein